MGLMPSTSAVSKEQVSAGEDFGVGLAAADAGAVALADIGDVCLQPMAPRSVSSMRVIFFIASPAPKLRLARFGIKKCA